MIPLTSFPLLDTIEIFVGDHVRRDLPKLQLPTSSKPAKS